MPRPPKPSRPRSFLARFFFRGLITILPIVLTFVIFGLAYQLVTDYVTGPINRAIYFSLERTSLGWKSIRAMGVRPYDTDYIEKSALPVELANLADRSQAGLLDREFEAALAKYRAANEGLFFRDLEDLAIRERELRRAVAKAVPPVFGVVLSLLLVLWLGWLAGGFVGRRIVSRLDDAFNVIPVVRTVYPYSKQLVEFFFAEKQFEFETVVAIPYPSTHIWCLAFVTSKAPVTVRSHTGKNLVTVFVPSSPMPMTGYTVFVEADRCIPVPITVDEALRITMTGGVIIPPAEAPGGTAAEALADADVAPAVRREERV